MSHIKHAIELLTNILKENGFSIIAPETFRLAKFDNDFSAESFWRLIFELICFSNYNSLDDEIIKIYSVSHKEEIVLYIKEELWKRGYISDDLINLPDDMSYGSRDLLLVFAWLFCKEKIIDQFIKKKVSILEDTDENLFLAVNKDQTIEEESVKRKKLSNENDDKCTNYKIQQLLIMNNKLRIKLNTLYSAQLEKNILKNKLYEATLLAHKPRDIHDRVHLTAIELYLIKSPENIIKYKELLEADNVRLVNFLLWKEKETIFWKWMESVLEEKVNSSKPLEKIQNTNKNNYSILNNKSNELINRSYTKLHKVITEYKSVIGHMEKLCFEKSNDVSIEEIDSLLSSIDQDILSEKEAYKIKYGFNLEFLEKNHEFSHNQFLFYLKNPDTSKFTNEVNNVEMSEEIKLTNGKLQNLIQELEEEVSVKQHELKEEIANISNKFDNSIYISSHGTNLKERSFTINART